MAKKKSKESAKNSDKKKPAKTTGKNKSKTKAVKKLKTLISQAHPVPETFVQKKYNVVVEKLSQYPRLVSFKNKLSQLYHSGLNKCKNLLYPK